LDHFVYFLVSFIIIFIFSSAQWFGWFVFILPSNLGHSKATKSLLQTMKMESYILLTSSQHCRSHWIKFWRWWFFIMLMLMCCIFNFLVLKSQFPFCILGCSILTMLWNSALEGFGTYIVKVYLIS